MLYSVTYPYNHTKLFYEAFLEAGLLHQKTIVCDRVNTLIITCAEELNGLYYVGLRIMLHCVIARSFCVYHTVCYVLR